MPYACPVCDAVEADAEHLANHLAVTASLREGDHAMWLDEHAPDWSTQSPTELGATVVEHAEELPVDNHRGHAQGETEPPRPERDGSMNGFGRAPDQKTRQVLREARALTRQSLDDAEE